MHIKPISLIHSIAEHYLRDGQDFIWRFDILWEMQTHKTGRIKSFVDLLMACECTLKAHIALGRIGDDECEVYRAIRKASHQLENLAAAASFLADRTLYDELSVRFQKFSVIVRYSLDAHNKFFPLLIDGYESKIDYAKTIGNNAWILSTRALLQPLILKANDALSGLVSDDIDAIFSNKRQMNEFMETCAKWRP